MTIGYLFRIGFGIFAAAFGIAVFVMVALFDGPAYIANGDYWGLGGRLSLAALIAVLLAGVIVIWPPAKWWHAPVGLVVFVVIVICGDYLFGGPISSRGDLSKLGRGPLVQMTERLLGEEGFH